MGTRHKVKIIKDNKVIINQYGQFDGYPTVAGKVIVDFLNKKENQEFLKSINPNEKFDYRSIKERKDTERIHEYMRCANVNYINEETGNTEHRIYLLPTKQVIDILCKNFDYELVSDYIMIIRNTGYKVLDVIRELDKIKPNEKIPIYLDDYEEMDIEARYIVNLDKNYISMEWHGITRTYNFSELPNTEKLEQFEQEYYKLEENEESEEF